VGKNKLARWKELGSFANVIQPGNTVSFDVDHPLKGNWKKELFGNDNPLILELACGKGEYTVELARLFPGRNFTGVDIKGARMWRGAKTANQDKLTNCAFLRTRIEFINSFFNEDEVDEIWITFPDPHPGKRNSNKRLTCPFFLNKYRLLLKDNGIVHLKTDNYDLYSYTLSIARDNGLDIIMHTDDLYTSMPDDQILSIRTHYETLFLKEGAKINYLSFRLPKNSIIEHGSNKRDPES